MAQVFVDRDNVNDDSVIVRRLRKASGDTVSTGDVVLEYETSKTLVEAQAPAAGMLSVFVTVGDEVDVGSLLFEVGAETAAVVSADSAHAPEASSAENRTVARPAPQLSRRAQALAAELAVDVTTLQRQGWVTSGDIRALSSRNGTQGRPLQGSQLTSSVGKPRDSGTEPEKLPVTAYQDVPTSKRKRAEARALIEANQFGTTSTIGVRVAASGARLVRPPPLFMDGISDLVIFEGARLLRLHPELNAFHLDDRRMGRFGEIHFGISFDSGANLKVLALKHADTRTLTQIQNEFTSLLELYEAERPIPEDLLTASTVTLSDLSRSAADFMLPLVNGRQGLIIGITRGEGGYRLFGSFDHRVTEGLAVTRFLEQLAERVANHFAPASGSVLLQCAVCDKSMAQELTLGHRGLIRMTFPDGTDGLMCRSCFEGL